MDPADTWHAVPHVGDLLGRHGQLLQDLESSAQVARAMVDLAQQVALLAGFAKLKTVFSTAPVLVQPDPSKQFVVEVEASDVGVGAVLHQCSGPDHWLHPCGFFPRRFTTTEAN